MGRAQGHQAAVSAVGFDSVFGVRRGRKPGSQPWDATLTETGQARVAALCQQVRLGQLAEAVALLQEYGRYRERPGLAAISHEIAAYAVGRAARPTRKRINSLIWKMGILHVSEIKDKSPLSYQVWRQVEQECGEHFSGEVPALLKGLIEHSSDDYFSAALDANAQERYEREAGFALARIAAADGAGALKRIFYGKGYERMCREVGRENPAELLDIDAWKHISLDLLYGPPTQMLMDVQKIVRRELDEQKAHRAAENLSS